MKKYIILFFLAVFLAGVVSATLESAAFGFAKDMSMSYLSSQNPELGQAISFVMCPECAATSQTMSALNEVLPGSSELINALQSPEAYIVGQAKQRALAEIYKQLEPEEQKILSNIQKFKPYIEEAFKENQEAPEETQKGGVEVDEQGNAIIKDSYGEVFAVIPQGFEAVEDKDKFILINKDAEEDSILEIRDYKLNVARESQVSFSEEEGIQVIHLEKGDVEAGGTQLLGISNASIELDENQIQFAEFTSEQGGKYVFSYSNQSFVFNARQGGRVLFDVKEGKVAGENTEFGFGYNLIQADKFSAILEGNEFKEINIHGGSFVDRGFLKYSSNEDFSIYFDGRNIAGEGNAVSVLKIDGENIVKGKGFVNIAKSDILSYTGQSQDAFVDYYVDRNLFDVQAGDAVIKNEKREILVKEGEIQLSRENLISDKEAESFGVKVRKDGKEIASLIDEVHGELVTAGDGEAKVSVIPFSSYEKSVSEKLQYDSPVSIDKRIEEIDEKLIELRSSGVGENVELINKLELSRIEYLNMKSISSGDYDDAIRRLENYLSSETPRDAESEFMAKMDLAEMYAYAEDKEKLVEIHESIVRNSDPSYGRYGDFKISDSRFALGQLYIGKEDYKNARWAYNGLQAGDASDEQKSLSELGLAYVEVNSGGEIGEILQRVDKSISYDSINGEARELRRKGEIVVLDKTVADLRGRSLGLGDELFAKIGEGLSIADAARETWDESARIFVNTVGGRAEELGIEYQGKTYIIDKQQLGAVVMRGLLKKGEIDTVKVLSDERITPLEEEALLEKIGRTFNLDSDGEVAKSYLYSLYYAKDNPSVKNLMERDVDKKFRFEKAEDYIDSGILKHTWKDSVLSQLDMKNLIIFSGTGKLVQGAGKVVKLVPGVAKTFGGVSAIKKSIAGSRAIQAVYQKFPTLTKVGSVIGSEVGEEILASPIKKLSPEAGLIFELGLSHAGAVDILREIVEAGTETGIKTGIKSGKVFFTEGREAIFGIEFPSYKALNSFVNSRKGLKKVGGHYLYESNGNKFYAYANPTGDIEDVAKKIMEGHPKNVLDYPSFEGYDVIPLTPHEWESLKTDKALAKVYGDFGVIDPNTRVININIGRIYDSLPPDSSKKVKQKAVEGVITHELFHAKFKSLTPSEKQAVYDAFLSNENFPEIRKIFFENRDYKELLDNDRRLIEEIIAHSGEQSFLEKSGFSWEKSAVYKDMLRKIETDFLIRFDAPEIIEGKKVLGFTSVEDAFEIGRTTTYKVEETSLEFNEDPGSRILDFLNPPKNSEIDIDDQLIKKYLLGELSTAPGSKRSPIDYEGGLDKLLEDYISEDSEVRKGARTIVDNFEKAHDVLIKKAEEENIPLFSARNYLETLSPRDVITHNGRTYSYDQLQKALDFHDLARNKEMRETFELLGITTENEEVLDKFLEIQTKSMPIEEETIGGVVSKKYRTSIIGPSGRKATLESWWYADKNGKLKLETVVLVRPLSESGLGDGLYGRLDKTHLDRVTPYGWIDRISVFKSSKFLLISRKFSFNFLFLFE